MQQKTKTNSQQKEKLEKRIREKNTERQIRKTIGNTLEKKKKQKDQGNN